MYSPQDWFVEICSYFAFVMNSPVKMMVAYKCNKEVDCFSASALCANRKTWVLTHSWRKSAYHSDTG